MYIYYEAHRITPLCPVPTNLGRPHNGVMTMSSFPSAGTWQATLGTATGGPHMSNAAGSKPITKFPQCRHSSPMPPLRHKRFRTLLEARGFEPSLRRHVAWPAWLRVVNKRFLQGALVEGRSFTSIRTGGPVRASYIVKPMH